MSQIQKTLGPLLIIYQFSAKVLDGYVINVDVRVFSCDQTALRTLLSVHMSVSPSVTSFSLCSHHHIIIKFSGVITNDRSDIHTKGQGQRSKVRSHSTKNHWFWPKFGSSGLNLRFEFTDGYEMKQKAWSSIEEVPYCFSRSSQKFQGHTGQKNHQFLPKFGVSGL